MKKENEPNSVSDPSSVILIDGSLLEGGGQVLRNVMAFSGILQKPVKIVKIREKRDDPGLKAQHLCGIRLIRDLYQGILTEDMIKSKEITFVPKHMEEKDIHVADAQTAGSIVLLIQQILPCLVLGPSHLRNTKIILKGGTNAEMAPQIDYLIHIFQPIVERHCGLQFTVDIIKRGFYPKGGGEVHLRVNPCTESISPIIIVDPGQLLRVHIQSFVVGNIPLHVGELMTETAVDILSKAKIPLSIMEREVFKDSHRSIADGTGIILWGITSTGCILGGSALGKRGKRAEDVGADAANEFIRNWEAGGCVDEHLQDQLIIFMALAKGQSRILTGPLTMHTRTAIHFATLMAGAKFTVESLPHLQNLIICQGIGYIPMSSVIQ